MVLQVTGSQNSSPQKMLRMLIYDAKVTETRNQYGSVYGYHHTKRDLAVAEIKYFKCDSRTRLYTYSSGQINIL